MNFSSLSVASNSVVNDQCVKRIAILGLGRRDEAPVIRIGQPGEQRLRERKHTELMRHQAGGMQRGSLVASGTDHWQFRLADMTKAQQYHDRARACIELGEQTAEPNLRRQFFDLASQWEKLAQTREVLNLRLPVDRGTLRAKSAWAETRP